MNKKYVISLKPRSQCDASNKDLENAIREFGAEVIENRGIRSMTVQMPPETAAKAMQAINFATIEVYEELNLL